MTVRPYQQTAEDEELVIELEAYFSSTEFETEFNKFFAVIAITPDLLERGIRNE
jgi:hypothetical protein